MRFFPCQVLQEEVLIPGSDLKMTYLSSRASGYKPVLKVAMTQSSVPFNLMKVRRHLKIFLKPRDTQKNPAPVSSRFILWSQWWDDCSRSGFLRNPIYPTPTSGTKRTLMGSVCTACRRQWVSSPKSSSTEHPDGAEAAPPPLNPL